MKEAIILIILSGLVLFAFVVTLFLGFKKRSMRLKLIALFLFIAFLFMAIWTGYQIVNKTFNKVADTFGMRTGDEIYDALFDPRETDCVEILNYQDQIVPKIDYAIWLHFNTCPKELARILSKHEFSQEKLSADNWKGKLPQGVNLAWFNPATLGDTIMVYEYATTDNRNIQTIWTNMDSTEVFVRDLLD